MARKRAASPKAGQPAKKPTDLLPKGYDELLHQLKERIRSAQLRAGLAVNREMVLLYWQIGRDILQRQAQQGWGAKVIDRLAADLHRAFPDMTGLSPRNLKYMRAFADAWPDEPIVQGPLAQITWYHNIALLEKLRTVAERLWYARADGRTRLEPRRPRALDRERPLSAPGQGDHQLRQEPPFARIRPGPGNPERSI